MPCDAWKVAIQRAQARKDQAEEAIAAKRLASRWCGSLKSAAFVPIFFVMSITDAKKPTKARQPRASALKATTSRKTAKPKPPVNGVAAAYVSNYTVGDHISHPLFGSGTVTAIAENKLTIEFSESVTKQIIDGYVRHRQR